MTTLTSTKSLFRLPLLMAGLGLIPNTLVMAQTFTLLHTFTALTNSTNSDGVGPNALILTNNMLYGTTQYGGSSSPGGTVFSMSINGMAFTNLYSFGSGDGYTLNGGLILSGNILYGTSLYGGASGSGTVFAINTNGTGFTNLHSFMGQSPEGVWPQAGLILSGTTLYGTASEGGSALDGTVFAVNTDGTGFTNLHTFTGNDGFSPYSNLILSSNTLYGTARLGGHSNRGVVFAVNIDGTGFTNLYSFTDGDGGYPITGLILSSNTLYGTTGFASNEERGTVFALNTDGTGFRTLHYFIGSCDGSVPTSMILSGNTLYGTTYGAQANAGPYCGTVFSMRTDGTGFNTLYRFSPLPPSPGPYTNAFGANPFSLILSGNTLYGTAIAGGASGSGTVFSIFIQPQLAIIPSGQSVILTWPTNYDGFTLQSATNLVSPVWTTNSPAPVVVNGQNTVTNPISGTQQFYRLSQ